MLYIKYIIYSEPFKIYKNKNDIYHKIYHVLPGKNKIIYNYIKN